MKGKPLLVIAFSVGLILLLPFVASQFTEDVNWTFIDYFVMGFLLVSVGLLSNLVLQKVKKLRFRIALLVAILMVFLLVWVELVVGFF